jgi:hypothetical protein
MEMKNNTNAASCRYLRFLVAIDLCWTCTKELIVLLFPAAGHGEVALGACLMVEGYQFRSVPLSCRSDQGSGEKTRYRTERWSIAK